jgi:hypothetical protein
MGECAGVRSPDEFAYPTGTGFLRNSVGMTTNSGGYAALMLTFNPEGYYFSPLSVTGGTIVWAGGSWGAAVQQTALNNLAALQRTVAWGVRITPESSFSNISGHMWAAHVPIDNFYAAGTGQAPTNEAGVAGMPLSEKWSLSELATRPLVVSGRAIDDGIYRFRSASTTPFQTTTAAAGIEQSYGWCNIMIYVAGAAASTTVLNIEVVQHVEFVQDGATLYSFVDAVPGAYRPDLMTKSASLQVGMPVAYLESAVDTLSSTVSKIAEHITGGLNIVNYATRTGMNLAAAYSATSKILRATRPLDMIGSSPLDPPLD